MGSFLSAPILILAAALQITVLPQVSILGGRPDLVYLITVSWALNSSLEQGVIWAFVGGICKDLLSAAPLGSSIPGVLIIIFAIHAVRQQIYSVGLFTLIWVSVLGTLFQQMSVMTILYMVGFQPSFANQLGYGAMVDQFGYFILPTVAYNLFTILPVYWGIRWVQRRLGANELYSR